MDPLIEDAIYHDRPVRVVCVGAGPSGICLAYKLQRSFRKFSLKIYEKNSDIGGTWFENRYPGCACDVPAHNYTYSFEPKSDFTKVYSGSREIRAYFDEFCTKYSLRRFINTSHAVTSTAWDPVANEWTVEVLRLDTGEVVQDKCDILVHATGYLNKPSWPKVPGLELFKGPKLHSAAYDESVSLEGKNVLIIGSGSSAVQILPAIQPIVDKTKIFIRSPSWLLPQISNKKDEYSPEEVAMFMKSPELVTALRQENERVMNSIFTMYMKGTVLQQQCVELLSSETRRILGNDEMADKLIPSFAVGCKRVIPTGSKYLEALKKDNVDIVHSGVTAFTETGCIDANGEHHEGDIIICATGFDTSYVPRYPVLAHGRNLQAEWAQNVNGYMGVGIGGFPNTFTMLGPYSPVSNGPMVTAIEAQADYICHFIDRWQTEPIRSITLKQEAADDFAAHVTDVMRKLVWTDGCRNSHNNHVVGGRTPTTWPGSTLHYLEAMREPRGDDWEVSYQGNRFSFLGTGISQTEWDPTSDAAYYIRTHDDSRHGSRLKRTLAIAKTGSQPPRQLHRQAKLGPKANLDGDRHEHDFSSVSTSNATTTVTTPADTSYTTSTSDVSAPVDADAEAEAKAEADAPRPTSSARKGNRASLYLRAKLTIDRILVKGHLN